MKTVTTIDKALITLAIEELHNKNEQVTVQKVSSITGYPPATLYYHHVLDQFIKRRMRKRNKKPIKSTVPKLTKECIDQSLDGYISYIKTNYFSRPESLVDVRIDMSINVDDFSPSLFKHAINRLQLDKLLKQSPVNSEMLIGDFEELKSNPQPTPIETSVSELRQNIQSKPEDIRQLELVYSMPLSNGVFKMTFEYPSYLTDDDRTDMSDYIKLCVKRKIQS